MATPTPPLALPALPENIARIKLLVRHLSNAAFNAGVEDAGDAWTRQEKASAKQDRLLNEVLAAIDELSDRAGRGDAAGPIQQGWDVDDLLGRAAAPVAQPPATSEALRAAVREVLECPYVIDEDTVPRSGLDTPGLNLYQVVGTMHVALPRYRALKAALATQPPAPVQQTEAVAGEASELTRSTYGVGLIKFCAPETALRYLAKRLREAGIDSSIAGDYAQSIEFLLARRDDLRAYSTLPAPAAALPPVARTQADEPRRFEAWCEKRFPLADADEDSDSFFRALYAAWCAAIGIEASTGEQSHG